MTDAQNILRNVMESKEPTGWDSEQDLTGRFRNHEWTITWEGREANVLADLAAKFTATSGISLFCDEFILGESPQQCLDVILKEQLSAGL